MKVGFFGIMTVLACCLATARAEECADLARMFASASQSMRVGDLSQLKDCIADVMQRKAQVGGDLPDVPSFTPPGGDADSGMPHINLDIKPDSDGADSSRYSMPATAAGNN